MGRGEESDEESSSFMARGTNRNSTLHYAPNGGELQSLLRCVNGRDSLVHPQDARGQKQGHRAVYEATMEEKKKRDNERMVVYSLASTLSSAGQGSNVSSSSGVASKWRSVAA